MLQLDICRYYKMTTMINLVNIYPRTWLKVLGFCFFFLLLVLFLKELKKFFLTEVKFTLREMNR